MRRADGQNKAYGFFDGQKDMVLQDLMKFMETARLAGRLCYAMGIHLEDDAN